MAELHCIENAQWLSYSEGKLSASELEAMERHVLKCEVCADIKAGIDLLENKKNLGKINKDLHDKIDSFLQKENSGKTWIPLYWKAAAILIFGLALTWYFIQLPKSSQLAKQPQPSVIEKPADSMVSSFSKPDTAKAKDQILLAVEEPKKFKPEASPLLNLKKEQLPNQEFDDSREEDLSKDVNDLQGIAKVKDSSTLVTTPDTGTRGIAFVLGNNSNLSFTPASPSLPANGSYATESLQYKSLPTQTFTVVEPDNSMPKKKAKTSSYLSKPAPAANNANLNNLNDKNALNRYFSQMDSLNYVNAEKNFAQKDYKNCIEKLKTLLANQGSLYYERSLLLKAKCLMAQSKKAEARTTLATLIHFNGPLRFEAGNLLKQLK